MELLKKIGIILIISLIFLMNNPTFGQKIKLDNISVRLIYDKEEDSLYFPYEIYYHMLVINDYLFQDFYKEHLIFGVSHYPKIETKYGIFRININGEIFDLINRGYTFQLVLYGDTLSVSSELHNKVFLSMAFKKEDFEEFKQSLKNIKITYHPIVEDYCCNALGTYFIREDYEVIIEDPVIHIINEKIFR